ncbi:MAG TPA: AsmA-like C-terminal region-containing protein, partial [Chitinophagaceae bacterium]
NGLVRGDMKFRGSKSFIDKGQYDKISFSGNSELNNIVYKSTDYPDGVNIQSASLVFNTGNVILKHLNGVFQNTKFSASGALSNMIAYALDKGALKGEINVSADKVHLNEWMGEDTASSTTASSSDPMLVPGNVDVVVNTKVDAVVYDKVTYKNVSGRLKLADETVHLQNVKAEALDGQMNFDGSYSTKTDRKQPAIDLAYSVKDIDVQKAFFAYNTMQKLMPIGQFLAGKMNSQFSMHGKLGADLFPQLSSLSGKGDLLLIQGVLGKFKPLEKIASVLQVDALKEVTLKDIKTHFEFANGKVLVKPFALKVKDIDMLIGGTHGLDQTMDYLVAMKIPRHYLGEAGNALVNNITTAALKKGIPIQSSEIVNLNLRMTGAMNNPSVKTDLKEAAGDMTKEMKDQAASFVQHKADSTKQAVRDTLSQAKKQVIEDVKKDVLTQLTGSKDSSGKKVTFDSTKKRTEETIKGTLNNLFNKKKKTEN